MNKLLTKAFSSASKRQWSILKSAFPLNAGTAGAAYGGLVNGGFAGFGTGLGLFTGAAIGVTVGPLLYGMGEFLKNVDIESVQDLQYRKDRIQAHKSWKPYSADYFANNKNEIEAKLTEERWTLFEHTPHANDPIRYERAEAKADAVLAALKI